MYNVHRGTGYALCRVCTAIKLDLSVIFLSNQNFKISARQREPVPVLHSSEIRGLFSTYTPNELFQNFSCVFLVKLYWDKCHMKEYFNRKNENWISLFKISPVCGVNWHSSADCFYTKTLKQVQGSKLLYLCIAFQKELFSKLKIQVNKWKNNNQF